MIAEKTIKMSVIRDGQPKEIDVRMRYCAATEIGFESLSGKKIDIFMSTPSSFDDDGNPTSFDPPVATTEDYLTLAIASIVAAYGRTNEEPPVKSEDIMYEATPYNISEMLATVVKLRSDWYLVPKVVQPDMNRKTRKPKNA